MTTRVEPFGGAALGSLADAPLRFWARALLAAGLIMWAASFAIGFRPALAVLTALAFAAAIAGLRWPGVGLLGVGVLCAIDPMTRTLLMLGGLWRWNTFNYWLVIATAAFLALVLPGRGPQLRLLQLLALLLGLEVLISPNLVSGMQDMAGLGAAFGLLVYSIRASRIPGIWYWLAVVCGGLAAAGGLAFFLQEAQLPFINPNSWAKFPLTGLFTICLGFPTAQRRHSGQGLLLFLAAVNSAWVFLSGSRGSMLVALCVLLGLLLMIRGLARRTLLLGIGIVIALMVSTVFADLQARALHRIQMLVSPSHTLAARTSQRSVLAATGWAIFLRNPLGVGTGGFSVTYRDLDVNPESAVVRDRPTRLSHSAWIKVLAENGIPGFVLLAAYTLSFAVSGIRRADPALRIHGLLVTIALSVVFVSTEFQTKGPWLFASAVTALLSPTARPHGAGWRPAGRIRGPGPSR